MKMIFTREKRKKSLSVDFRLKIYTHKSANDVKVLLMLMKMNMNKSLDRFGVSLCQI